MGKKTVREHDFFVSYENARVCLGFSGARMLLIRALVILLLMVLPYYLLGTAMHLLSVMVLSAVESCPPWIPSAVVACVLSALTLFFTLPLCVGFLRMAKKTQRRVVGNLNELFGVFSDKDAYHRALRISFFIFWRVGLLVLLVFATCEGTVHFFAGSLAAGLICAVLVLLEIAVGILLLLRHFPFVFYAMDPALSMGEVMEKTRLAASRDPMLGLRFFLGLFPWLLLGTLTFGILLVWDVLPRASVAYFDYCRQLHENIRLEEYKK